MPRAIRRKTRKARTAPAHPGRVHAYRELLLKLLDVNAALPEYSALGRRCEPAPLREAMFELLREGHIDVLPAPGFVDFFVSLGPKPIMRKLRALATARGVDVEIRAEAAAIIGGYDPDTFARLAAADDGLLAEMFRRRSLRDLYMVERHTPAGVRLIVDALRQYEGASAEDAMALIEVLREPLGTPAGLVYPLALASERCAPWHDAMIELLVDEADFDARAAVEAALERSEGAQRMKLNSALSRITERMNAGEGRPRPVARAWMGPPDMDGVFHVSIVVTRPSGGPLFAIAQVMAAGPLLDNGDVLVQVTESHLGHLIELLTSRSGRPIEVDPAEACGHVLAAVPRTRAMTDEQEGIAATFRRVARPGDPAPAAVAPGELPDVDWLVEQLDALGHPDWRWHAHDPGDLPSPDDEDPREWIALCCEAMVPFSHQITAAAAQLAGWQRLQGQDESAARWAAASAEVEAREAASALMRAIATRSRREWAECDAVAADGPADTGG